MSIVESRLGGLITLRKESSLERQIAFKEADAVRAEAVRTVNANPTSENNLDHLRAYRRVVDLLNFPLEVDIRFMGIRIPILSSTLPSFESYKTF